MSTQRSPSRVRSTYEFIKAHRAQYSVQTMCRVLAVAPSGYYEWLQQSRHPSAGTTSDTPDDYATREP